MRRSEIKIHGFWCRSRCLHCYNHFPWRLKKLVSSVFSFGKVPCGFYVSYLFQISVQHALHIRGHPSMWLPSDIYCVGQNRCEDFVLCLGRIPPAVRGWGKLLCYPRGKFSGSFKNQLLIVKPTISCIMLSQK